MLSRCELHLMGNSQWNEILLLERTSVRKPLMATVGVSGGHLRYGYTVFIFGHSEGYFDIWIFQNTITHPSRIQSQLKVSDVRCSVFT